MIEDGLTDAQRNLIKQLRLACQTAPAAGRRYGSAWEIVLDLGIWCRPASFPSELRRRRGPERACYANAARLATAVPGLRYVEGFADPGLSTPMAFDHAWCIDADGTAIDPTWDPPATAYLGIPFSLNYRSRVLADRPGHLDSICLLDPYASPRLLTEGLPSEALT